MITRCLPEFKPEFHLKIIKKLNFSAKNGQFWANFGPFLAIWEVKNRDLWPFFGQKLAKNLKFWKFFNFAGRISKIATICHILTIQSVPYTPELLSAQHFAFRKFAHNWSKIGHFCFEMANFRQFLTNSRPIFETQNFVQAAVPACMEMIVSLKYGKWLLFSIPGPQNWKPFKIFDFLLIFGQKMATNHDFWALKWPKMAQNRPKIGHFWPKN